MIQQTYPLWAALLTREDGQRRLAAVGRRERCERMARHLRDRGFTAEARPLGRVVVVEWVERDATAKAA